MNKPIWCEIETGTPPKMVKQADAACAKKGDTLNWVSNGPDPFTIEFKDTLSGCPGGSGHAYSCTVSAGEGKYRYSVKTDDCVLDPRIIIN